MASSTPPPHYTLTTATKPYQNHHPHHHRQNHHWTSQKVSLHRSPQAQNATAKPPTPSPTSTPPPLSQNQPNKSQLSPSDFSGRRSTRFVSKIHFRHPSSSFTRHTSTAEEALLLTLQCPPTNNNNKHIDNILLSFESKLSGVDDYIFLLRELGNRQQWSLAMRCFDFAILRQKRSHERGKLTSSMISILGRLGKVDLAKQVFDNAVNHGYGNNVFAYSALISAYAKSGCSNGAIRVFESMKDSGLKPNLVTYNALIDACAKGGLDFRTASGIFDEMLRTRVQPDRITYNSLLSICSGSGLWETARGLFSEMIYRGIDPDTYSYNTLIDGACNSGHIDIGFEIMLEMATKHVFPNEVTYSIMIRGCAKEGRLDRALNLFHEMKYLGIKLDRVSYNTLVAIYSGLGRFEEAVNVVSEMGSVGIEKDVVTYNALLDGYGKHGVYGKVKELCREMDAENIVPNLLTYSILISVYSKGGLYWQAREVYREFKQQGLKADVVFYSKLIDALCKKGLVESCAVLLDEMKKEGIRPNVVTYNSIINAFGQSAAAVDAESQIESLPLMGIQDSTERKSEDSEEDRIINIFEQLATDKSCHTKRDNRGREEILCVLGVFQKMHELNIKPNVVTFSAILSACSHCNSFEEASLLLEELRLFDNQVYGVAHGLLMGDRENVWLQALSLFDEVKNMDSSTASAFYNALTDMLWHFGQKRGAQLVVLEGKRRQAWENAWSESSLDLHLMSLGAARAMVHAWLLSIRSIVFEGHELPKLLSILTGWGKHSKVVGDGLLKRAIEALLSGMGAPFQVAKCNIGRFISSGTVVAAWLRESGTLKVLVLQDDRTQSGTTRLDSSVYNVQMLPL